MKPKHKASFDGPTNMEALILANQAIIMQALAIAIGNKDVTAFIDKAVVNVHYVLKRNANENAGY